MKKKTLYIGGGVLSLVLTGVLIYYFFFRKKKEEREIVNHQKITSKEDLIKYATNTSLKPNTGVPFASDSEKAYRPFTGENLLLSEQGANQAYGAYINDTNRSKWTPEQLRTAAKHASASKNVAIREREALNRKNARIMAQIEATENQINELT